MRRCLLGAEIHVNGIPDDDLRDKLETLLLTVLREEIDPTARVAMSSPVDEGPERKQDSVQLAFKATRL